MTTRQHFGSMSAVAEVLVFIHQKPFWTNNYINNE